MNLRPPVPKTGALPDCATPWTWRVRDTQRVMGIEPISAAWKADNLPLIYTRVESGRITGFEPVFSESQSDTLTD